MTGEGRSVVLIVDDEESVAEVFSLWLEDDYEVRVANDGETALAEMDDDVDVVLLDRRMPGLSGDEVLAEMRERGYEARVAMVTAVDPDFDIVEMGFDDYLTKPVSRDDLHDTIDQLIALSDYDASSREQFALAQKLAALESRKPEAELEASDEYAELRTRFEAVRDDLDRILDDLDERSSSVLFRGLESDSE